MEQGNAEIIALLEERLRNLRDLGQAIQAAQQACILADLEALRTHDCHKEHLCAEVRRLDLKICSLTEGVQPAGSLRTILEATALKEEGTDAATTQRLRGLFSESEAAREEVARLNRVFGQFLARSRGTLSVMINVISHCLGVYPSLGRSTGLNATFERSY